MMDLFTKVVLAGAVLFAFAWVVVSQRRFFKELSDAYLRLTHLQRVLVLVAIAICTVYAQKPNTNDVQNGEAVSSPLVTNLTTSSFLDGPRSSFLTSGQETASPLSVTDVERGYRLESVTLNPDVTYTMPEGAVVVGTWNLTGAFEDVVRVGIREQGLGINGWSFPLGTHLCDSLWAYTWGMARPQLKNASNEIAAVGAPMSAIPDVSRFWTAATTNGSRLLTWENFVEGRSLLASSNTPTTISAQLELYSTGDFIARSNNVESVYRRVNPDDWDDDGIPNEDDPDPLLYGGDHFGPNQDMSFTSNLSAYCWVDIVVHQANARVTFAGDGASNLPDPSFIAEAEETYRVNLLIGKTYQVNCSMPFEVVGKSDNDIDTWWDDGGSLWINWYVDMWAADGNDRSRTFRMFVSPSRLDGGFTWTKYCCSISGSGSVFTLACREGCSCGGCCAEGEYLYEGYSLPAYGGYCACCYEDDPEEPHPDDTDDPPVPVGVSAGFSRKVIFFEDAYANTTNQTIPWYSQVLELACSAYGGPNGGSVTISLSGDGNLVQYGGQAFPISRTLQPYEVFCFTNTYRAVAASSSANDIVVTANFVESETGWTDSSNDRATAVKVEIEPVVYRDGCLNRHRMGVREGFYVKVVPEGVATVIPALADWNEVDDLKFECPIRASTDGIRVEAQGSSYHPALSVVEPIGIVCPRGFNRCQDGYIAMELEPYIIPLEVCFSGVRVMEVPTAEIGPSGYFTNSVFSSIWYHSIANGAGVWHRPGRDNLFFNDTPSFAEYCPPPIDEGVIDWVIPLAWAEDDATTIDDRVGTIPTRYHQLFTLDAQGGLRIDKFTQWIKCSAGGIVTASQGIH